MAATSVRIARVPVSSSAKGNRIAFARPVKVRAIAIDARDGVWRNPPE